MQLLFIRIITENVQRLVEFYKQISGMPAVQCTENFAELKTKVASESHKMLFKRPNMLCFEGRGVMMILR